VPAGTVEDRFERPRRRPKLGTLITIGFVIFWAVRFINTSGIGGESSASTPRPAVSIAPIPSPHAAPGQIVFGEDADGASCSLDKRANRFTIEVDVYWEAEMQHVVAADATVVLVEKRDNIEIDRQEVPPDPDVGPWVRFCAGGPVAGYQPGVYRLEIWNEDETELLSSGLFTRYDATATASPRPSRAPLPTVLGSQTGTILFGTAVGVDCALSGADVTFKAGEDVWWRAELTKPLPGDTDVRVIIEANLATVADDIISSASVPDPRTVICGHAPVPGNAAGFVYVWVWNVDRSTAFASGHFDRTP
jgi:hypothetical protein